MMPGAAQTNDLPSEIAAVTDDARSRLPARGSAVDRHLDFALELLRAGRRPTLDMLVAENGGSRTTAQQALTALWEEHLPALLLEADSENTLPDSVRAALVSVWSQAMREAQEIASASLADDRSAVEAAKATVEALAVTLAQEREAARRSVELAERQTQEAGAAFDREREARRLAAQDASDARERAESLGAQLAQASQALSHASTAMARLETQRKEEANAAKEALLRAEASAEKALANARADAATMRADLMQSHEQAAAALKEAYVDSEARLRVEIDAHKTKIKHLERECDKLRQHNAEQAAHAAAHAAELEAAIAKANSRRRPWNRGATKHIRMQR